MRYPLKRMTEFIKKLHGKTVSCWHPSHGLFLDDGKRYMMIVDPGIFVQKGYAPYDEGVRDDLFIKSSNGSVRARRCLTRVTNLFHSTF